MEYIVDMLDFLSIRYAFSELNRSFIIPKQDWHRLFYDIHIGCYKNNLLITMITGDPDTLYVRAWSAAAGSLLRRSLRSLLRRSLRSLHYRQAPPLSISSTWVYIQLGMAFYSA